MGLNIMSKQADALFTSTEMDNYNDRFAGTKGNMEFTETANPWSIAFLKYMNFFLLIVAITLLGLGIYANYNWESAQMLAPPVIIFGAVIFILAMMGLYGSCNSNPEDSNVLRLYFFAMLFLMIMFLLCGSFCFVYKDFVVSTVDTNFDSIVSYMPASACDCANCTTTLDPVLLTTDEMAACKTKLKDAVTDQFTTIGVISIVIAVIVFCSMFASFRVLNFSKIAKPLLVGGCILAFLFGLGLASFGMYVGTTLQHIQEVSFGAYGIVVVGALVTMVAGYGIRIICCEQLTQSLVCCFLWSVIGLLVCLCAMAALCIVQMDQMQAYVDKNFDDGGLIRKNMGNCYCNRDMFSCDSSNPWFQCNERDISGLLVHWTCTGSAPLTCNLNGPGFPAGSCTATNATTGCCLSLPECKEKFVSAAESNLLACGILGCYVFLFLFFALGASCAIWNDGGYQLEETVEETKEPTLSGRQSV